jgi:AAA domain
MTDDPRDDQESDPENEREPDEQREALRPVYREALASLSRAISLAKDDDTRKRVFENAVHEVYSVWHGIERSDAFDALQDIAEARGFDPDWVQGVYAKALTNGGGEALKAQHAKDAQYEPEPPPFVLFDQIELVPKVWLAEKFLGVAETSCWYGEPGSGKSVLAEDFGLHVAAGTPWLGREVKQGAVLYIALERAQLVKRRALAFKIKHNARGLPFAVMHGIYDFRDKRTAALILQAVAELERVTDQKVVLIIVDTISRALCGGDENSPKDMGALVNTIGRIQEGTGTHITLIHHVPHEADRMRGHGSLLGAIDTGVHVIKGAGPRSAIVVKTNDGDEGAKVDFRLDSVELCADEKSTTTAPVVVPLEGVEAAAAASKPKRTFAPVPTAALRALVELVGDMGQPAPASEHIPRAAKGVTLDVWREHLFKTQLINRDGNYREQFRRIHVTLKNGGAIGIWENFVWPVT